MNKTRVVGVSAFVLLAIIGTVLYAQTRGIEGGTVETSSSFAASSYNTSLAAEQADIIVLGTVAEVGEARWPTDDGQKPLTVTEADMKGIYHPVTIRVEETLKGSPQSEITLRVSSGTINGYKRVSAHAPSYNEGERVLVFVQEWDGYYRTLWKDFGKFNLDQDVIERENVPEPYQSRINASELVAELRERYGPTE